MNRGTARYRGGITTVDPAYNASQGKGVFIGVLGPMQVGSDGTALGRRDRVVLSVLCTSPGRVVSAEVLVDAIWGDEPPASAAKIVQGCVSRLRKLLGAGAIQTDPRGYVLQVPEDHIDLHRFSRLVERARELMTLGEHERAVYALTEGLDLWRGRALIDLEDWPVGATHAAKAEQLRQDADEMRLDAWLRTGNAAEALTLAPTLVRAAPMRERRWALLALAQYQVGRQAEALASLKQARGVMVRELGLDPGPELADLERRILGHDPDLLATSPVPRQFDPRCPYRGLSAYEIDDAETFFGRTTDGRACLDVLEKEGVLVVAGPSGVGKSSLVRAGVAASVRAQGASVQIITPGRQPDQAVAWDQLSRRTVLVVDQAEELLNLCEEEDRDSFIEGVIERVRVAPVVLALRSDALTDVSNHPDLARMVERGLFLLGPMSAEDLRVAIEEPARQHGLRLEPGLVDLLLRDVEADPGALPLLSHALQETWKRREGATLTVAGYQATGGIRGAVTQSAEALYGRLDDGERHLLRELLLRLVSPGPAGEPVRARLPRRLVVADESQADLVDALVDARLVTQEEGALQIAHASLGRAWPRLRDWLDNDVEGRRILHHLTGAADAWDLLERPDSELYRGARLARVLEWRAGTDHELTATELAFLEASTRQADDERVRAERRQREQARLIRLQRGALVGGSALLVIALVAGFLALRQSRVADENAVAAVTAERIAAAGRLGAQALSVSDAELALLLGVEAVRLHDNAQTRGYLQRVLTEIRPGLISITAPASQELVRVVVHPTDPNRVAAYGQGTGVWTYDMETGESIAHRDLTGEGSARLFDWADSPIDFTDDGRLLIAGDQLYSEKPRLFVLDASTLEPQRVPLAGLPDRYGAVASIDVRGRHLAVSFAFLDQDQTNPADVEGVENEVRVWDLDRPRAAPVVIERGPARNGGDETAQISPDGRFVFTSNPAARIRLRDGRVMWERPEIGSSRRAVLTEDGSAFGVAGMREARVLDARTGDTLLDLPERGGRYLAFSGDRLVAMGKRGLLRVYEWPSGESERQLNTGLEGGVAIAGDRIYTAPVDTRSLQVWDATGEERFVRRHDLDLSHIGWGAWHRFSPDGSVVASLHQSPRGRGFEVEFIDLEKFERSSVPVGNVGGYASGAWRSDGREYATGDVRGAITWGGVDGSYERAHMLDSAVTMLAYAGDRLIATTHHGHLAVVDLEERRIDGPPVRLPGGTPYWVTVSPDGTKALSMSAPTIEKMGQFTNADRWIIVDLHTREVIDTGPLPDAGNWGGAEWSPAGDRVAFVGGSGVVMLDPTTGQMVSEPVAAQEGAWTGAWSSDGAVFASGADDGTVARWDGRTGAVLDVSPIADDTSALDYIQIIPWVGRHTMMAADAMGLLYRWDTRSEVAIEAACSIVGRSLTRTEWASFVGDRPHRETCPPRS